MTKLEEKILAALEEIRPFLVQDGGDISLESINNQLLILNYMVHALIVK